MSQKNTKKTARQYAHILFIADNKMDTFRKRLSCYQFSDFEYCGAVFMQYWTASTMDTLPEFDPHLAQDVRDLKSLMLNDRAVLDELRNRISNNLSQSAHPPVLERIQSNFKVVLRNMLSVGCMINQQKEVRNIFVEIADKLVDAFLQVGWSHVDMELFYNSLIAEFGNTTSLTSRYRERYSTSWIRLVTGIKLASIRLYRQPTSQSLLTRSFTRWRHHRIEQSPSTFCQFPTHEWTKLIALSDPLPQCQSMLDFSIQFIAFCTSATPLFSDPLSTLPVDFQLSPKDGRSPLK